MSTKLKVGVMWDHNGTYMEGFGFQYRDQQIQIDLNHKDESNPCYLTLLHQHMCCVTDSSESVSERSRGPP